MNFDDSSQPFQLHKFNVVELDRIFEHLSLVDIFHLSLTSPEIRNALSEASLQITGIKVSYKPTLPTIELISERSTLLWTSGYPENSNLEYAGEINIGRYSFKCMKSENGLHTDHLDIEAGFFSVLTYFTKIFKCKNAVIRELYIDLGVIEDCRTICSHYSAFKHVERLSITQSLQDPDSATSFGLNFDWIMNNLKPTEIYLGVEVMENILTQRRGIFDIRPTPKRFEKIFDTDHICILYSDWVLDEDLLKLDVKTACLMNSVLTDTALNTFIKNWLNSDSDKLCWMEVRVHGRSFDKEIILAGLDLQEDSYRLSNIKCSCPHRRFESYESVPFIFPNQSKQVTRADGSASASISIFGTVFFFHVKNDGPVTAPDPTEPVEGGQQPVEVVQQPVEIVQRPEEIVQQPEEIVQQPVGADMEVDDVFPRAFMLPQGFEEGHHMFGFRRRGLIRQVRVLNRRRRQQ